MKKEKKEQTKTKKHIDFGKIAVRVISAILAVLMVVAVAGTLIYYLLH